MAVQKRANLVDLEKCCKMNVWLQKAASIQPRTDLPKRMGYRHYPQTPSPCAWPTKQRRGLRLFPELPLFPGEPVEPDIAGKRLGENLFAFLSMFTPNFTELYYSLRQNPEKNYRNSRDVENEEAGVLKEHLRKCC